jgi:hypothetical protein
VRGYFYLAIPYDLLELILLLGISEKLKPVSRLQGGPVENEDSTFIFVVTREVAQWTAVSTSRVK